MSRPVITLTTDFGDADGYVGIMKGVILGICPEAALVDIAHQIRPQAVRQAAYLIHAAAPYFPPGTVHLVVVDPGVGSPQRPIVVQTERATYVSPDNGVLGLVLLDDPPHFAVHLTDPHYHRAEVSATFHGRDIFAPAAAYLALGADPRAMGNVIQSSSLTRCPIPQQVEGKDGSWHGEVLHVDRFGNLITNCRLPNDRADWQVSVGSENIRGLSRTFSDVEPGNLLAYVGSSGYLEIAVREGNAAQRLGIGVGESVRLKMLNSRRHGRVPSHPAR